MLGELPPNQSDSSELQLQREWKSVRMPVDLSAKGASKMIIISAHGSHIKGPACVAEPVLIITVFSYLLADVSSLKSWCVYHDIPLQLAV